MTKNLPIALFGHGFLGKWHAQKIQALPESKLALIVEPRESAHAELIELYPDCEIATSMKGREHLFEAAIIASPTSFHFDLCRELAVAKKHIFCEKPMTSTLAQALELRQLLDPERVFQVGHSERCHHVWQHPKFVAALAQEELIIEVSRQAPFKGRATDVDVVQDLMIHDIDLMLWLLEERPLSVSALGFSIRTQTWDHVHCLFEFDSGKRVLIHVGRNAVQEERGWKITSKHGQTYVDLFKNQIWNADAKDETPLIETYEKRDHLYLEQQSFYQAILKKTPPMVSFEDGLAAVYIVEKVIEALQTGRSIHLDIPR